MALNLENIRAFISALENKTSKVEVTFSLSDYKDRLIMRSNWPNYYIFSDISFDNTQLMGITSEDIINQSEIEFQKILKRRGEEG